MATAAVTADKVVAAIVAGRCDGTLADVIEAVKQRASSGATAICWRVTWGDLVVDEENLTINEWRLVAKQTGKQLGEVHPSDPIDCAAIITAGLVERSGMKPSEAFDSLKTATVVQMLRAVSDYEAVPPKDSAD